MSIIPQTVSSLNSAVLEELGNKQTMNRLTDILLIKNKENIEFNFELSLQGFTDFSVICQNNCFENF